jgi:hypothetical protein
MVQIIPQRMRYILLLGVTACVIFFLFPTIGHCGDPVTGRFRTSSGTEIVFILIIGSSAPTGLIVEQHLELGNSIIGTNPGARKIDDNGIVKWLFRKTRPGQYTLTTQLAQPLKGKIRTTVRYRAPDSGALVTKTITP